MLAAGDPQVNKSASSCPEATHLSRDRDTQNTSRRRGILKTVLLQARKLTVEGGPSLSPKGFITDLVQSIMFVEPCTKSRDITLSTVHLVKAMVFPEVMHGCESWTIKKAECQRIDAFELWCWRKLLRVPCAARRSNQSILKESCVFTGRTDVEPETPILWPPDETS